jgi:hypothetical protein
LTARDLALLLGGAFDGRRVLVLRRTEAQTLARLACAVGDQGLAERLIGGSGGCGTPG